MIDELLQWGGWLAAAIMGAITIRGTVSFDVNKWLSERRDRHFSAIRIVSALEEYFGRCVEVVFDDGTSHGQPAGRTPDGEMYLKPQVALPDSPTDRDGIDWKSLDTSFMCRVSELSKMARETDRYIESSCEHACPPDYEELFEARCEGYARLGLEALSLAGEIRTKYNLPGRSNSSWNSDWNPKTVLEEKIREVEQRRSQRAAALPDFLRQQTEHEREER